MNWVAHLLLHFRLVPFSKKLMSFSRNPSHSLRLRYFLRKLRFIASTPKCVWFSICGFCFSSSSSYSSRSSYSSYISSCSVLATVASVFRYSVYTFMRNGDLGAIGSRKTASHRGREALSHSILLVFV